MDVLAAATRHRATQSTSGCVVVIRAIDDDVWQSQNLGSVAKAKETDWTQMPGKGNSRQPSRLIGGTLIWNGKLKSPHSLAMGRIT